MDGNFTIDIPKPCAQPWDEMNPTAKGKFCSHCSTEVIDFTKMTTTQVLTYFQNAAQPVCGRIDTFRLHQLNQPPVQHHQKVGFSLKIAMASVMTLLLTSKAVAQQTVSKPQQVMHLGSKKDKANGHVEEKVQDCTFLIKGIVKSLDDGLALPGASVKLLEASEVTSADPNGMFKLQVRGSEQHEVTLFISYLGHLSKEIKVKLEKEPKDITVSLAPEPIVLGKVVVTVPKPVVQHIITGGITTVKIDEIKRPSFFKRVLTSVGGWFR